MWDVNATPSLHVVETAHALPPTDFQHFIARLQYRPGNFFQGLNQEMTEGG